MDANFSSAISNEDVAGILRTILLFLESINFKTTTAVLHNECSSKGYHEVVSVPAKIVVVHPSAVQPGTSHQGNQTEFSVEDDKPHVFENNSHSNSTFAYYDDTNDSIKSAKNDMFDKYSTRVLVSDNIYSQKTLCVCSTGPKINTAGDEYTVEKHIEEPKENQNMCTNNQNKNLERRRCPNTIESEVPTRISAKKFSENCYSEVSNQRDKILRKTHSNPTLKTDSRSTKVDDKNNESEENEDSRDSSTTLVDNTDCQELRKRFRQLQNEHRKLMGVTTELTTALQTHILGQSENLNSMLNNCRNIYPDLFKSVYNQNSNNFQNILTKHSSSRDTINSTTLFEDVPENVLMNQTKQQNSSRNFIVTEEPSGKLANQTNIDQQLPQSCLIIENTDNLVRSSPASNENKSQNTSPLKKGQDSDNVSQGSLPSRKTIQNSDSILKNSTPPRRCQDSNTSQASLPSSKTVRNSDTILQSSSPLGKTEDSYKSSQGTLPLGETNQNSCNIIPNVLTLRKNQNSNNNLRGLASSCASTIRNSDIPPADKSAKYQKTNKDNHTTGVLVEIKNNACNGSYSTTILTPKLKRPHSSTIILVTTTDDPQSTNSKSLLRQLSSKSLDESLLSKNSKASQSPQRDVQKISTTAEGVTVAHTTQIPEIRNAQQQTSFLATMNEELYQENPEIFVTTEHLEKLQRGCKCKSSGENNYSSPPKMYFDLDFRKLKKDMLNGDDNLKLGLIQALRWRITQSDSETRDQVISSYIRHDLLGLHSTPNSCGQSTTEIYYCPTKETPHPLQEGMARLVNTFASLTLGRDYLCQDDDLVISLLVPLVIGTHYSKVKIGDTTSDMLMATLQKLSIRNGQRMRMISAGLVEYLVTFLATQHATISEYCMEYTTALLMNLCLHREAREFLHSSATNVVSLLADLLNTKHRSCMPYVNGAMYSLLRDPYINKEAHRLNLSKLIEYHIMRTNGEMRRQLEFILKLHLDGEGQNDCACDPNVEPENEVDLLELELDGGDSIKAQPAGEELLKKYKLLFSVNGTQVNVSHLKCFCRPVTPRSVLSNEKSINVTDGFEDDKIIQVSQDDIIQETNFQVEQEIPQEHARQHCTCLAEKSTQSENPNTDGYSKLRSHTPQLCTCTTTASTTGKKSNITKRGKSLSEPTTGFKSDTEKSIKTASTSARSSRSNSPDMSYSEETKQFYHTPSAKTGIFEPRKPKKLHRVPPSFTRTIPLPQKSQPSPSVCENPFCPHPYVKSMPVTPKENSSVMNPPYALDYRIDFNTCYREGHANQMANLTSTDGSNTNCNNCSNNNKRSRYRCNCYNVIKGYIDQDPQENVNSNRNENSQQNTGRIGLPAQNVCNNCHNSNNVSTRGSTAQNFNDTTINRSKDVLVNFSYEELLNAVRPDHDHVCPNPGVDCQCYDVVFQSRPKILRTPP